MVIIHNLFYSYIYIYMYKNKDIKTVFKIIICNDTGTIQLAM